MRRSGLECALVGLVTGLWVADLRAETTPPDPQQIADRAIARATEMADRCANGIGEQADRIAAKVTELVNAGKKPAATRLAAEGIERINDRARNCLEDIRRICERAVHAITKAGGDAALAEQVKAARTQQVQKVQDARKAGVDKIKAALPARTTG